ncbi:NUDIX domain-containing protein [Aridibaculum aurantiacum]|uniref:NUDIX domain-containing protein n=1 Tax=Aridibaculum aurantiacum TaxID=2810307 RepID=UPI001A96A7B2|nr:NUDIX domain-containing protein [Aridibaculum aurantiacum]
MENKVTIKKEEVLSDGFFTLKKVTFDLANKEGQAEEQKREVYHTANGATVLLYNVEKETVILTRQFRVATMLNGNDSGMMIEACAGIIEDGSADETIVREIEEETGYKVEDVEKIFELYSSPGATTEKLHYYIARYQPGNKVSDGGGLDDEQENIEVLEMAFKDAYLMIENGTIRDAKTVQLLQYAKLHVFTPEKVFDVL